jgi:hypothetical protein
MNNAQEKRYAITEDRPVGNWNDTPEWEWIPHERQPMALLSVIKENRELFQELNNDFWLNHVEPFFISNDACKLQIQRAKIVDEKIFQKVKSGFWDGAKKDEPIHNKFNNLIIKHVVDDETIDYQDEIYNRAEKAFSEDKISGCFALDTVQNALLLFVSSDIKNCTKYLYVLDLRSKIFTLPITQLQTLDKGEEVGNFWGGFTYNAQVIDEKCEIPKDYSGFETSYGFDVSLNRFSNSHLLYNIANHLVNGNIVISDDTIELIRKELKLQDFYKELLADGFMEYVNKEKSKNTKIKLPKNLNNKMDFSIWKNVASKTKTTKKTFDQLVSIFGWAKSRNPYFFEAINHLLNNDEKLHTRKYFIEFIKYEMDIYTPSEISDNINSFWFDSYFENLKKAFYPFLKNFNNGAFVGAFDGGLSERDLPYQLQKYFNICYSIYLIDNTTISTDDKAEMVKIADAFKGWLPFFKGDSWIKGNAIIAKLDTAFWDKLPELGENEDKIGFELSHLAANGY